MIRYKHIWWSTIVIGLTSAVVFADNRYWPEVAFTPIICVIGLLVMALTLDQISVAIAFLVFLAGSYISLTCVSTFDANKYFDIVRLWLRLGAFTITGILAVFISFYRRKLKSQLDEHLDLFQSIPLPIIVTDGQWLVLDGNLKAAKVLGVNVSNLPGKSYEIFFHIICETEGEVTIFNNWMISSEDRAFQGHLLIRKSMGMDRANATIYKLGSGKTLRYITILHAPQSKSIQ